MSEKSSYSLRSLTLSQCRDLRMGVRRFRSFKQSACATVLNLLEAIYLKLRNIVVERVTVVKFRAEIEAAMVGLLAVLESR